MPDRPGPNLQPLVDSVSPFRADDLLAKAAGLQLLPQNASRLLRLGALAHAAATKRQDQSLPAISGGGLRRVTNGVPLVPLVGHLEDPYFAPFTESVFFHGGDYVVLPGLQKHSVFIVKCLCTGLFFRQDPFPNTNFAREAFRHLKALLTLSHEVSSRAGLKRNCPAPEPDGSGVTIPARADLLRLAGAVRFSETALAEVLERSNLNPEDLSEFTVHLGGLAVGSYTSPEASPLLRYPLVAIENDLIVAAPTDLLTAWLRWVLERSRLDEITDLVAQRFCDGVWRSVRESLLFLRTHPRDLELPSASEVSPMREQLFAFDTDKILHVVLVTDSLSVDRPEQPDSWDSTALGEKFAQRASEIWRFCCTSLKGVNEVLHLLLVQSLGRWTFFGIPDDALGLTGDILTMNAQELATISILEVGNPLALRQFVHAKSRFEENTEIMSWSALDTFHLYRRLDHSFYLSDGPPLTGLSVQPNEGDLLHCEVLTRRDFHGARSLDGGTIEVTAKHDSGRIPIYFAPAYAGQRHALLVEGYAIPVWVVAEGLAKEVAPTDDLQLRLVETIAYWLWQFLVAVEPALVELAKRIELLVVQVEAHRESDWSRASDGDPPPWEQALSVTSDDASGRITVIVYPELIPHLTGFDNAGERELMRHVLAELRNLVPDADCDCLSDAIIARCIEEHAPLGPKKMFLTFDVNEHPSLRPAADQRPRLVQAAPEQHLLDQIGVHLRETKGLQTGKFPTRAASVSALNSAVAFTFGRMESLVASLSSDGVLERLVEMHEWIVRERDYYSITLPTRLACYSTEPELAQEYARESSDRSQASIALRFLVEYVTARPPSGLRPFSLTVFDELLAMASTIVNFGFQSDFLQSGVLETEVSILESGRLGIDRDVFTAAREIYMRVWAGGEISRRSAAWRGEKKQQQYAEEENRLKKRFSEASAKEFGYSFDEFTAIVGAAIELGMGTKAAVVRMSIDDFVKKISSLSELAPERIRVVLPSLTLEPRQQFLKPSAPFVPRDVYPWRFFRPLSLSRRPFVARHTDGAKEMIWGPGHLAHIPGYFRSMCLSGRLQATTQEMRQVVGTAVNFAGRQFNTEVAELLARNPDWVVQERVAKIGGTRIADHGGNTLGDVDVLAISPREKRVYVLECKDMAVARTPRELANEIAKLLGPWSGGKPAAEKHGRRVVWITENLRSVIEWGSGTFTRKWQVFGGIVTSMELFGPMLRRTPLPIASLDQVRRSGLGVALEDSCAPVIHRR